MIDFLNSVKSRDPAAKSLIGIILTYPGEEDAANTIRYNNLVLAPKGFPKTTGRLLKSGFNVVEIENTECAKIDGGMSCLSLRFSPNK